MKVKKQTGGPKQDGPMTHVIVNDYKDKKAKKHQVLILDLCCCTLLKTWNIQLTQVDSVPWPYSSKKQFENSLCTPVGRHWNTEAVFQQNIKPNVTVATGMLLLLVHLVLIKFLRLWLGSK